MTTLPDPELSRVLLVGAARYRSQTQLPAVANNVRRLAELFTDPRLWGVRPEHCVSLLDPAQPDEVLDALWQAANAAADALVFYFGGHGLVQPDSDNLYLALADASLDQLFRGVRYDDVRSIVMDSPAAMGKVVLLDCCYSGLAMKGGMGGVQEIGERVRIDGTYLMTASAETVQALAPEGEELTAFTGQLVRTMGEGIPNGPEVLDLDTVYWHVRNELAVLRRPIPQQRARNYGNAIGLVRNRRRVLGGTSTGKATSWEVRLPVGYEEALFFAPEQLFSTVNSLRVAGKSALADEILFATGAGRTEQGVAAVVEYLAHNRRHSELNAVLGAAAQRPSDSVLDVLGALAETDLAPQADVLLRMAAERPADEIGNLAKSMAATHGLETAVVTLLTQAVDARVGRPEETTALVAALLAANLADALELVLEQVNQRLPSVEVVLLADALREGGYAAVAYRLYAGAADILAERPASDIAALAAELQANGLVEQATKLVTEAAQTRTRGPQCVDLIDAIAGADLGEPVAQASHVFAQVLADDDAIEAVLMLHYRHRTLEARTLALAFVYARPVTVRLRFVTELLRSGLPILANQVVDDAAKTAPQDLLSLAAALLRDGHTRLARRATETAVLCRPETAVTLLRSPRGSLAQWALTALAEKAGTAHILAVAAVADAEATLVDILSLLPEGIDPATILQGLTEQAAANVVLGMALLSPRRSWFQQLAPAAGRLALPSPEVLVEAMLSGVVQDPARLLEPVMDLYHLSGSSMRMVTAIASRAEVDAAVLARAATHGRGPVAAVIAEHRSPLEQAKIIEQIAVDRRPVALDLIDYLQQGCPPERIFKTVAALDRRGHDDLARALLSQRPWLHVGDGPVDMRSVVVAHVLHDAKLFSASCAQVPMPEKALAHIDQTLDLPVGRRPLYLVENRSKISGFLLLLTDDQAIYAYGRRRRHVDTVTYRELAHLTVGAVGSFAVAVDDHGDRVHTWPVGGSGADANDVARLIARVVEVVDSPYAF